MIKANKQMIVGLDGARLSLSTRSNDICKQSLVANRTTRSYLNHHSEYTSDSTAITCCQYERKLYQCFQHIYNNSKTTIGETSPIVSHSDSPPISERRTQLKLLSTTNTVIFVNICVTWLLASLCLLVASPKASSSLVMTSMPGDGHYENGVNSTMENNSSSAANQKEEQPTQGLELYSVCNSSKACSLGNKHSICLNGSCQCINTFVTVNSTCIYTNNFHTERMLPLMIVLAVMFIGICVAMNLFSRARFKKQRNAFIAGRVPKRPRASLPVSIRGDQQLTRAFNGRTTPLGLSPSPQAQMC